MSKQPRLYLFHGNDSRASSLAVKRWEDHFRQKYGEATRYIIEADELSPEQVVRQLSEVVEGATLFQEPKLVIVKRSTSKEKANSTAVSKNLAQVLGGLLPQLDEQITLAFWEEKQLGDNHPLFKWFRDQEEKLQARIHTHTVPQWRQVGVLARAYLAEQRFSLTPEGERWLLGSYQNQEKAARLAKRLKSTEQLAEDDRSWWLYQLLDGAMLRASNYRITEEDLRAGALPLIEAVGVFELVNGFAAGQWDSVRGLARTWEELAVDDSSYFGLYALLRMQFQRQQNRYGLRLLAEIEVISKNFSLPHGWLVEMLIVRLESVRKTGEEKPLLPARTLWLAQVRRS